MKLSENLSLAEVTISDSAKRLGINNTPTKDHLIALTKLANNVFQPIRDHFKVPIHISSGYRSSALNKALKGASNSQHCKGEAIDIDMENSASGVTNSMIFNYIKNNLIFDQLIWEFGDTKEPSWVHVSYSKDKEQRNEILIAYKEKGITKYKKDA